ncbi:hypothetical protein MRX96_046104 [Rhipicephalus microplus]
MVARKMKQGWRTNVASSAESSARMERSRGDRKWPLPPASDACLPQVASGFVASKCGCWLRLADPLIRGGVFFFFPHFGPEPFRWCEPPGMPAPLFIWPARLPTPAAAAAVAS